MDLEKLRQELLTLKARIATLEAQIKEPEWVPFPGELIEVKKNAADDWTIRVATGGKSLGEILAYGGGRGRGTPVAWLNARPLSDPNIIQLRLHTPGDPMPCSETHRVLYRMVSGEVGVASAKFLNRDDVTAWAPLPQVSP